MKTATGTYFWPEGTPPNPCMKQLSEEEKKPVTASINLKKIDVKLYKQEPEPAPPPEPKPRQKRNGSGAGATSKWHGSATLILLAAMLVVLKASLLTSLTLFKMDRYIISL